MSQEPSTVPQPQARSARFWILGTGAIVLAVVLVWGLWPEAHPPAADSRSGDTVAIVSVDSVPSLSEESHRVADDPSQDGWESEVLHRKAKAQMKVLAKVLAHPPISIAAIDGLFTDDVAGTGIVVANPVTVFDDGVVEVWRRRDRSAAAGTGSSFQGMDQLLAALNNFHELFGSAGDVRAHFKLFRLSLESEAFFSTKQHLTLVGRSATGTVEEHATWQIRWKRIGPGEPPRIMRVDVVDWERAIIQNAAQTLFSDCSASVLGNEPSYREQLMHGFEFWLGRLQETRYLAALGNPGIALGDVNGDGLDDLYLCQESGLPNRLYLQRADGTVGEASAEWEVDFLENSRGALLVDLDNDGDQDLAVAVVGGVVLAENEDQKRFRVRAVAATGEDAMSLAAVDFDRDARLDLYVCAYHPDEDPAKPERTALAAASTNFVIHDANTGGSNTLLKNQISPDGPWHFLDVTNQVGLGAHNKRFSLAAAWEDYDNDGDLDLYVANDFGRDNLYRNELVETGTPQFRDVSNQARVETAAAGMGITWGDIDRDGWMDVYVSNMFSAAGNRVAFQPDFKTDASLEVKQRFRHFSRGNTLLRNSGNGQFQDVSVRARVAMGRWAWGSRFIDFNNDGWEDIAVPNGYITTEDSGDL